MTTHETRLSTTIEQHIGSDAGGARYVRSINVVTKQDDFISYLDWNKMADRDPQAFADELARIHEATVALESLDAEPRAAAKEWLAANNIRSFDGIADLIREAIREAAE